MYFATANTLGWLGLQQAQHTCRIYPEDHQTLYVGFTQRITFQVCMCWSVHAMQQLSAHVRAQYA
jgi:hypothetical protein